MHLIETAWREGGKEGRGRKKGKEFCLISTAEKKDYKDGKEALKSRCLKQVGNVVTAIIFQLL